MHNDRYRGQQFISIDPSTFIDDGKTSRKPFREFPVLPDDRETIQVIGRGMKDGTTLAVVVYMSR